MAKRRSEAAPATPVPPEVAALVQRFTDLRDRFATVALHDRSAPTFEVLDGKMKDIIETKWNGRELPFPILLDSTGRTYRNFSITSLGTAILIDPQG
ncbi:MAG: hypothetical protein KJZ69_15510 [Phycisphaerales bacterium]|nr:hypothetical protein [Phycisphaerales bacterium]